MTLQAERSTGSTATSQQPLAPQPETTGAAKSTGSPGPTGAARSGTTFAALAVPNFRLYLSGQIVSLCGTWMQTIALGWLVLSLGASGTALGLVTAARFGPVLLFGPYGGLIADRADRRRLLICTQVGSGLAGLVLGILDVTGTAQLWMVAVTAAVIGLFNAVDNPARQSFVQEMVGPEHLPNAITLNSVTMNAARIIGPALAGLIIIAVGTAGCFFIDAASFGAVVVALCRMDTAALHDEPTLHRAPGQLRAGFAYVRANRMLRIPLIMMMVIGALSYEFQVVMPLMARETFAGTATTYSLMTSAMGAGAVAGGLLVARRRRIGPRAMSLTAGIFGVFLLLAAAAPTLPLEIVALVFVGATSVAFISTGNATVQLSADPAMRGRVMALWSVAFLGTTPLGGPVAGWFCQMFGARSGLVLAGGAALAAALYAMLSMRSTRSTESTEPTRPTEPAAAPAPV